jgi:hypothetical protein
VQQTTRCPAYHRTSLSAAQQRKRTAAAWHF